MFHLLNKINQKREFWVKPGNAKWSKFHIFEIFLVKKAAIISSEVLNFHLIWLSSNSKILLCLHGSHCVELYSCGLSNFADDCIGWESNQSQLDWGVTCMPFGCFFNHLHTGTVQFRKVLEISCHFRNMGCYLGQLGPIETIFDNHTRLKNDQKNN